MAVSDTLIDTLFDGRYLITRKLGAGGMANVYLAEDQELGRRVAIKILNERHANDEQFVERFRREAKNAAGLSHPNVVSVYDRGEAEGTYYIAMEHLSQTPEPPSAKRPEVPHDLDLVVLRALAKDPADRYRSAEEMDADLERIGRGLGVSTETAEAATTVLAGASTPPPVTTVRPGRYYEYDAVSPRRRTLWPWLLALGLLVVALAGGFFAWETIQDQLNANKPVT